MFGHFLMPTTNQMENKKQGIDIVNEVLEACIMAYPVSSFIISLYKQYVKLGSLSRKQLVGLYAKASGIADLPSGKLAALEALIHRMPVKLRSEKPAPKPLYEKADQWGEVMQKILARYPEHKRVLFLQSKYRNNEPLTPAEIADLKRFLKML